MEPEEEMRILRLIIDGFHDVNRVFNPHLSLISRLKITMTPEMEDYLFDEYFKKRVERVMALGVGHFKSGAFEVKAKSKKTMKKVDLMRIQNMNTTFGGSGDTYDHLIMDTIEALVTAKPAAAGGAGTAAGANEWMKHYYTLKLMLQKSVTDINSHIVDFANFVIDEYSADIEIAGFLRNAYRFIEQNENVFKYADFQLYDHQNNYSQLRNVPTRSWSFISRRRGRGRRFRRSVCRKNTRSSLYVLRVTSVWHWRRPRFP